jgi:multiple sugar transport system ATP-binding protein
MSGLRINGVHKFFGAVPAVRGVSLDIPSGEFVVLVGPSGCGKTTLLRSIAGLEEISRGSILLGGREIHEAMPRHRNIAMVFQSYALYPFMTVFDNIAFGLRARKTPKTEIDIRVRRAADMLGMSGLLDRYPRELSGGQRQRVAIGRAVVRDAELFLFDEPLSNLDAQLRDEMRGEIKRLHQRLGKTMIYVTHDQVEAMTLADRIVLMRDGVVEQQGAPLEMFERPATRFVAGFLGSPQMNFIPCRLLRQDDGMKLLFAGGTLLRLHQPPGALSGHEGRDVVFGVRPEHMSRLEAKAAPRAGHESISACIELVQPTGTRTFVQFPFGGVQVTAELPAHSVERPGVAIQILVDMSRSILIDPVTERVLSTGVRAGPNGDRQ